MGESPHSASLDLSVAPEPRISIKFDGWADTVKELLLGDITALPAVTNIKTTGGNTGAYVYFNPRAIDRDSLHQKLSKLVASDKYDHQNIPAAVAIAEAPLDQFEVSTDPNAFDAPERQHDSYTTTGVETARTKLREVSVLLPSAMHFVEALIGQAEMIGHNGGPEALMPSDIEQLRPLHQALGELLEMSDAKDWDDQRFEGLIADIGRFSRTVQSNLADDKPYVAGLAMISAIIGIFNPVAGASIAAGGIIAKGQRK